MKKKTIKELKNEFKELKIKYAELGEEVNNRESRVFIKFIEKLRRLDDILSIKTDNRIGVKNLKKSVVRFIDKNNLREAVLQSRQRIELGTLGLMAASAFIGFNFIGLLVKRRKRGN